MMAVIVSPGRPASASCIRCPPAATRYPAPLLVRRLKSHRSPPVTPPPGKKTAWGKVRRNPVPGRAREADVSQPSPSSSRRQVRASRCRDRAGMGSPPPLPHHRTCGPASGGSSSRRTETLPCRGQCLQAEVFPAGIGQGHAEDLGARNPPVPLTATAPLADVAPGNSSYPQIVPPGGSLPFPSSGPAAGGGAATYPPRGPDSRYPRAGSGLYAKLNIAQSHSRPHVSNDNPYSEAQFKTLKYCPAFPGEFGSIQDANVFCEAFFTYYNTEHRHSGIAMHTPATVHDGSWARVQARRAATLQAAYQAHPERFRGHRPHPRTCRRRCGSTSRPPPSKTSDGSPGRAGILRRLAVHPTISAPGGHGMILIERGVDTENTTYRVSLAGADP